MVPAVLKLYFFGSAVAIFAFLFSLGDSVGGLMYVHDNRWILDAERDPALRHRGKSSATSHLDYCLRRLRPATLRTRIPSENTVPEGGGGLPCFSGSGHDLLAGRGALRSAPIRGRNAHWPEGGRRSRRVHLQGFRRSCFRVMPGQPHPRRESTTSVVVVDAEERGDLQLKRTKDLGKTFAIIHEDVFSFGYIGAFLF